MNSLANKISEIQGECAYVQKDGKNQFHNYKYASAANVLEKVNESCAKHKIASFPRYEMVEIKDHTNAKGNREYLAYVKCDLKLVDAETGETDSIVSYGCGQDPGDKAIAKAQTMALKYAWMTCLNISTGDDPEADEEVDKRNAGKQQDKTAPKSEPKQQQASPNATTDDKMTTAQRGKIFALQKELSWSPDMLRIKANEVIGKTSLAEVTVADAKKLIDYLEKQKGAN